MLAVIFFLCSIGPYLFAVPWPTFTNILDANKPIFSARHVLGTTRSATTSGRGSSAAGALRLRSRRRQRHRPVVAGMFGAVAGISGVRDAVMMRFIDM